MIKIKTYKVFSTLLLYPTEELKNNVDLVLDILKNESIINVDHIYNISLFVEHIKKKSLISLQEEYVSLFDRKKQLSLYLFEHIHGDSRDRGMAMVDLKNLYKMSDFDISIGGELPDYIPLFLEYLSLLSFEKSSDLLSEIVNIISIIKHRLKSHDSVYYFIFSSIESLSKIKADDLIVNKALSILDNDSYLLIDKNNDDSKIF